MYIYIYITPDIPPWWLLCHSTLSGSIEILTVFYVINCVWQLHGYLIEHGYLVGTRLFDYTVI